jgi:hypothetical protein
MNTTVWHDIVLGDVLKAELQLSEDLVPISGATVNIIFKRLSDDYYWSGSTWQVGVSGLVMAEYDATNFPGYYTYSLTPTAADTIIATMNYGVYYESHSWLVRSNQLQDIEDKVSIITAKTNNLPADPASDDITRRLVQRLSDKVAAGVKYTDIT